MESWEDEGGLTTLRLLQQEPWVKRGVDEVKERKERRVQVGDKTQEHE